MSSIEKHFALLLASDNSHSDNCKTVLYLFIHSFIHSFNMQVHEVTVFSADWRSCSIDYIYRHSVFRHNNYKTFSMEQLIRGQMQVYCISFVSCLSSLLAFRNSLYCTHHQQLQVPHPVGHTTFEQSMFKPAANPAFTRDGKEHTPTGMVPPRLLL